MRYLSSDQSFLSEGPYVTANPSDAPSPAVAGAKEYPVWQAVLLDGAVGGA